MRDKNEEQEADQAPIELHSLLPCSLDIPFVLTVTVLVLVLVIISSLAEEMHAMPQQRTVLTVGIYKCAPQTIFPLEYYNFGGVE